MAYAGSHNLEKRLSRIEVQRRKLNRGVVYSVNQDGLIVARPRRRAMRSPFRLVLLTLVGIMAFKAFLFASLGGATYQDRVDALAQGTVVEQAGAWIMQADPATQYIAIQGKLLLSDF